ncbi:hypothetical protein WOLCODRAFT_78055 [Wolfiporia cocos MD-104 SS10]|uniref:Elongation factor methyltransferase 7 n=1 Tax=Wolfiporia cocos (strain MD-104) TaxID=742152 RepID=A0A2H3K1Q6_WOLCO|nr:hypothetical protein WOLCODRAFT_78055 [Wolfiporia cocos MD-104 SS10]
MSNSGKADRHLQEPPRPPSPEPTTAVYERRPLAADSAAGGHIWARIDIRLVGSHPLWAHHLWNASRAFATFLDKHQQMYRNGAVLELGAGGGLPGIVAALNGARKVVLTDYPDTVLLENMSFNVNTNIPAHIRHRAHVEGYIWGQPVERLLTLQQGSTPHRGFDLIIMSDLIFNHSQVIDQTHTFHISQHNALLKTCEQTLRPRISQEAKPNIVYESPYEPCLLVFYTHHRPHLAHRDTEFFSKAKERGWKCEEILTERFPPMFPDDPGEEEVRATVHGWRLTRS